MTRRYKLHKLRATWALLLAVLVGIAVVPPDRGPFLDAAHADWAALPLPTDSLVHEVLLVGDTGVPQDDPLEPALALLRHDRRESSTPTTTIFLGDNVYPSGIPDTTDPGAEEARRRLSIQLDAMAGLPGGTVFVPGNHDWGHHQPDGAVRVARQQRIVQARLGEGAFPIPPGTPGPATRRLADDVVLVALDTGWFLYENAPDTPARHAEEAAFGKALRDTLAAHAGERIVVVGHHPLYSNGQHSGRYPFRSHIYPLIELRRWAFVPLPGLGTLAFWYAERYGLSSQDLGHARYRRLRTLLTTAFAGHEHLVYAAGHDHNLQYFAFDDGGVTQHMIVSGAGASAKTEEVVAGYGMGFGYAKSGVARLRYYAGGETFLEFVVPKKDGNDGEVVFRTRLQ